MLSLRVILRFSSTMTCFFFSMNYFYGTRINHESRAEVKRRSKSQRIEMCFFLLNVWFMWLPTTPTHKWRWEISNKIESWGLFWISQLGQKQSPFSLIMTSIGWQNPIKFLLTNWNNIFFSNIKKLTKLFENVWKHLRN